MAESLGTAAARARATAEAEARKASERRVLALEGGVSELGDEVAALSERLDEVSAALQALAEAVNGQEAAESEVDDVNDDD